MNPVLLIGIVLFLPLFFFVLLCGPIYVGMCASLYFYYDMTNITEYMFNVGYVFGIHQGFYNFMMDGNNSYGFSDFILPVYGPVLLGVIVSLYSVYKMVCYIRGIFILAVND